MPNKKERELELFRSRYKLHSKIESPCKHEFVGKEKQQFPLPTFNPKTYHLVEFDVTCKYCGIKNKCLKRKN